MGLAVTETGSDGEFVNSGSRGVDAAMAAVLRELGNIFSSSFQLKHHSAPWLNTGNWCIASVGGSALFPTCTTGIKEI